VERIPASSMLRRSHLAPEAASETARAAAVPRLGLLDAFRLVVADRPVALPLTAQRVLAFVALRRRPLLRAYVAGSLWRDVSESHAQASLRSALWRLQRTGHALVDVQGASLGLAPEVELDVREVVRLSRRALAEPRGADDDERLVARLVALGGELLPDWYDEWVTDERETVRQLRLRALEALASRLCDAGRLGAATDAALAAVAGDPVRESAHRALIAVQLAEGNLAAAVRQYRRFRALSRESLGVGPSPQIEELIRSAAGDAAITAR
jgi:DNA-binding SARP family transcriptional activator